MNDSFEGFGSCDGGAKVVSYLLREVVNDIVLKRNDETYTPVLQFNLEGFKAEWWIEPDEGGEWESCIVEVHHRKILGSLNEIRLACEVVPGIFGTRVRLRPVQVWKTTFSMKFEVEAAIDDRAVNFLIAFDPDVF